MASPPTTPGVDRQHDLLCADADTLPALDGAREPCRPARLSESLINYLALVARSLLTPLASREFTQTDGLSPGTQGSVQMCEVWPTGEFDRTGCSVSYSVMSAGNQVTSSGVPSCVPRLLLAMSVTCWAFDEGGQQAAVVGADAELVEGFAVEAVAEPGVEPASHEAEDLEALDRAGRGRNGLGEVSPGSGKGSRRPVFDHGCQSGDPRRRNAHRQHMRGLCPGGCLPGCIDGVLKSGVPRSGEGVLVLGEEFRQAVADADDYCREVFRPVLSWRLPVVSGHVEGLSGHPDQARHAAVDRPDRVVLRQRGRRFHEARAGERRPLPAQGPDRACPARCDRAVKAT